MIDGEILTMDDFDFHGKTVLLRVDFNSALDPKTKKILDDFRIRAHEKTIKELLEKGAKVVILAHQGDPLFLDQFIPLEQHARILSGILGREVKYIDDIFGPAAREAIRKLGEGEVLVLENTRYFSEDTRLFEDTITRSPEEQAQTLLVQKLYPLADVFINDAFAAAHKSQPSLVGFAEVLPAVAGRALEAELRALSKIRDNPERPCVFFLGGSKISDRYVMMEPVLKRGVADKLLTSGIIGLLMLKASGYSLGDPTESLIKEMHYEKYVSASKHLLDTYGDKIEFPTDLAVDKNGRMEIETSSLPTDSPVMDIGKKTVEKYSEMIKKAKTVFFSGPPGMFEREEFASGTERLLKVIVESGVFSVVGGGHSVTALEKYSLRDKVSYVSTGGGALVRYLSGEELPVVTALKKAAKRYLSRSS
ncbi:phosphoglycerate kinase [Candidatus Hecatella orcuttiae]|jgi:phosphoglycerate kinase|uniref:phosphoglycerate kinase n=1 Tax=Candidatus Hecatella orcuttiae TaxID=1935119 RepID=UPI002867BE07|nr:phosphoglycerate kinase [Candidatus Hecatella orcuttiae]